MSSARELHGWTFSAESIAACTVHDALSMIKHTVDDYDFFWLGRVPCRSVKIVGMVVGIQVYERKVTYTVDDGTGVIDCIHSHQFPKSPPKITSRYKFISTKTVQEPLSPVAQMGHTVRVTGSVRPQYDTRVISIDQISQCPSLNEEFLHSRTVRELHKRNYSSKEPFVIPKRSGKSAYDSPIDLTSKLSTRTEAPPSSVSSSPVRSSPIKDPETKVISSSPPKLRHPSRLHTHDLTENTFRIYLKHYIDHAANTPDYDSDIMIQTSPEKMSATPTKQSRVDSLQGTPRQSFHHALSVSSKGNTKRAQGTSHGSKHKGFTISYLRRVPELSLLAYRVVQAVAKRREREKRKRLKDVSTTPSLMPSMATIPSDKLAGKMKRLFQWAIIQLLREGCIVLWDGPVQSLPASPILIGTSRLWKTRANCTSVFLADDRFFNSDSRCLDDDFLSGYVSDPQPDEESYISLTPSYLSDSVLQAIQFLVELQVSKGNPYTGAAAYDILGFLKKDDQWRHVGLWNIQDTLEFLKDRGTVWDMGKGRWDLTA